MPPGTAPLLLIDAPSLLYRAWFGLPDSIKGATGQPVNALLGTANMTLRAVAEHAPRAVLFCDGAEAAHYRKELYPPYHADRPPTPDGLLPQMRVAPTFFAEFGWYWDESPDLEADDLLGAYAAAEDAAGGSALILTGDRDMFQCVTEQVTVLYPQKGGEGPARIGPQEVEARYGVAPNQVADFIALRGDPSDGIPGAKGIGEKTAASLLRLYHDLDGVLRHADEQKPGVARALGAQQDELRMFLDLATLRPPVVRLPDDAPTDPQSGANAAEALGMNRLAERLRS